MISTLRLRPHALIAVLAALACLATALAATPAEARPAGAKWPWVIGQSVQGDGKVSVRLQWKKIARSKKYRIDYAPLKGSVSSGEVQKSGKKKSKIVKGQGGKFKSATLKNLKPGKVYCFQVYGVSGKSYGNRGGVHCKMTTKANRRPGAGFPMMVGTYNTCSSSCTHLAPWGQRAPLVRSRILQMKTGGRVADVVAIQEGTDAVPYLDKNLTGFTKGCQTSDGVKGKPLGVRNQSLYVRTSTYDVIPGSAGGFDFKALTGAYAHGVCWVKVRHKLTKREAVVVSTHLSSGSASVKTRQLRAVYDRINSVPSLRGVPRVYAGDFNSNASHKSRKHDVPLGIMRSVGFDSAFDMGHRIDSLPFYNSGGAGVAKARTSWTWNDHVDRVYVAPGVHVASWKVDYRIQGGRNVQRISDHNPVLASLVLR